MAVANKHEILVLIVLIIYIDSKVTILRKINKVSEINLTIIGTGKQYIFRDESKLPSELYINGVKENSILPYLDNLLYEENKITMRWENDLKLKILKFEQL